MPELRQYQLNAIQLVRIALTKIGRHIIMVAPCGAGKTEIAAKIIQNVLSSGKKVIFMVDRIVLAEQASARFDKYEIPHGILQGQNERYDPEKPCQIVSAQTLIRRKIPDDIDVIIVDEAHVRSAAVDKLKAYNPDAFYIGLTATPFAKGMAKFWHGVVVAVTTSELTDNGYLVPTVVYAAPKPELGKVKVVAGEYQNKSLAEETDKPKLTADIVSTWKKRGEDRQTLVFAVNRAHAKHIEIAFNDAGVVAESIDCYTKDEERQVIIDRFNACEIRVLVSVMVLTVGFDSPVASCAILACATKSKIKHLQSIGRVLRLYDGKKDAIILDHGGNTERLGFATDDHDYVLDDGKPKKKQESREAKEKLPKACPSCDYIKPAGVHKCPACGFAPERIYSPDFEDGELVEIKKAKKARKEYSVEEKQKFLGGLNMHAKEKGYRKGKGCWGWALKQYEHKFGCSPSSKIQWGYVCEKNDDVKKWIQHMAIAHAANVKKMRGEI